MKFKAVKLKVRETKCLGFHYFNNTMKVGFRKCCEKKRNCWEPVFSPLTTVFSAMSRDKFCQFNYVQSVVGYIIWPGNLSMEFFFTIMPHYILSKPLVITINETLIIVETGMNPGAIHHQSSQRI